MVWNDEQTTKWAENWDKNFDRYKKIRNSISNFAFIINLSLCILLIIKPQTKILCPFVWFIDAIIILIDIRYHKLMFYPLNEAMRLAELMQEISAKVKDKSRQEILKDKKILRKIRKAVKLINKYDKFMQKHYEKD